MLAGMSLATSIHATDQSWLGGTTIYDNTYAPTGLATDNDLVDTGGGLIVTNGGNLLANQLVVGQTSGNGGTLTLAAGGSVAVRTLLATNNTLATSGSFVNLNTGGTLTTSNLNAIAANIVLPVPNYTNTSRWIVNGTWNMNGGTNYVTYLYSNGVPRFTVGANSTVSVNPNAVLNLTNSTGTNMDLFVGYGTAGGKFVVNGGTVTSYRQLQIGLTTGAGNSLVVTNGGTLWGGSGPGAGTLQVGAGNIGSNSLTIVGSGSSLVNNGLTLNVGYSLGSSNNIFTIDGGMATNVGPFTVGALGNCQGNTTIITNGGQLFSTGSANIGNNTNANNNAVYVSGTGSLWNAGGASVSLATAANLTGNNLTINGGLVTNINNVNIGSGTMTNDDGNSVIITNGGQLYFTGITLCGQNGMSNAMTVAGPGSMLAWTGSGSGNIYIGRSYGGNVNSNSAANWLALSNGAQVLCFTLALGRLDSAGAACSNNYAIIGGGGASALLNASYVTIGFSAGATNNYLALNAGGIISNTTTISIGVANSGGSRLNINGGSIVGKTSGATTLTTASDGQLFIQSGGAIFDDNGTTINANVPLLGDPASPGGGLVKNGAGYLFITGACTYSGGTLINAGTLKLGNSGLNGSVLGNITNNAVLSLANTADQIFGNAISGTGMLTKTGVGTATLTAANTYTGKTIITTNTLALSGAGSIDNSTNISIAGGAILDVSGKSSTFTLGSNQTIANSSMGAVINGTNNCSSGTIALSFDGTNACFIVTNGGMTLSSGTVVTVQNSGPQLTAGTSYKLIAAQAGGSVRGSVTSNPITVGGNGAAGTARLAITAGELYLNVASASAPQLGVSQSGNTLNFSWTASGYKLQSQTNALGTGLSTNWADYPGGGSSPVGIIINPTNPSVFFRLAPAP